MFILKGLIKFKKRKEKELEKVLKQNEVISFMTEYGRWLEHNDYENNIFNYEKYLAEQH